MSNGIGKILGNDVRKSMHNAKTFLQNNTSFGRMIAFDENFFQAWKNAGKCSIDEFKAYGNTFGDAIPIGRIIKHKEGLIDALVNSDKARANVKVKSDVPRNEYESHSLYMEL